MPDTFQALAVLIIGLLPGALYIWAFEGVVGRWGAVFSDRILRFIGVSGLLHVVAAPLTYWFWFDYVRTGRLSGREPLPLALWPAAVAYVVVPMALGRIVGTGTRRRWRWPRLLTGRNPAPRAWDDFFGDDPEGWVRLRLRSGAWIGGALGSKDGKRSYAAGYPEDQDLYLVETAEVDQDSGEFLYDDDQLRRRGSGLLVRSRSSIWSSFRDEEMAAMAVRRRPGYSEKRGGYTSGPKPVSELKPPPRGPGIGARPTSDAKRKSA